MRLVVAGTSTEIGKTHVGVRLLRALSRAGVACSGLKPIESGLDEGRVSDRELLADAGTFHVKHWPYGFNEAVSPHLAAARSGIEIELSAILEWVAEQPPCVQLVELPGGLLSPVSRSANNLDLLRALKPALILLVAPDKLGVLSDVTALALALRSRAPELSKPRIILNAPAQADASTGTNAQSLRELGIDVLAGFPRGESGHDAALEVLRRLSLLDVDGFGHAPERVAGSRQS